MWPRRYGRRKGVTAAVKPSRRCNLGRSGHLGKIRRLSCRTILVSPRRFALRPGVGQGASRRSDFGKRVDHGLTRLRPRSRRASGRGGQAVGCWDWSAEAVARLTLPAHRPGGLPGAFIACANGNLVLEGASRLDAFSAYPVPTWLPGGALSRTAGTPEVGPPQSSRTRGDAPQVSCAHGR